MSALLQWLVLASGLTVLSGCAPMMSPVTEGEARPGRGFQTSMTAGKAALVGNQAEPAGYGLYSYILLGAPFSEGNGSRYLEVLSAFVSAMTDIKGLEDSGFDRRALNITYVLLKESPQADLLSQSDGSPEQVTALAKWLRSHYNYARARFMLRNLPRANGGGPYLISTLQPLSVSQTAPKHFLFQDLSSVPLNLVNLWVREFLDRANQPRTWDRTTANGLALKLRTTLTMAADGLPQVEEGLKHWLAWIDQ